MEKYWLNIAGLPESCLRSAVIDNRSKSQGKEGKLPFGTAHVNILASGDPAKGIELFRLVEGYIKTIHQKLNHAGIV